MSSGSIFNSFSRIKLGLSIPSIKSHGVVKVDIKVVSVAAVVVSVAVKNQRKIKGILCDFILNLIRKFITCTKPIYSLVLRPQMTLCLGVSVHQCFVQNCSLYFGIKSKLNPLEIKNNQKSKHFSSN